MTLDTRQTCSGAVVPPAAAAAAAPAPAAAEVEKEQDWKMAGISKLLRFEIFNAEKIIRENATFLEVHTARLISSRAVWAVWGAARRQGAIRRDGRQYGPRSVALARWDYLLLGACNWTTS